MGGHSVTIEDEYKYRVVSNERGKFCVPTSSSYTYTSQAILAGRVHEPGTIDFIIDNHKGMDVIHAGAGFGDFLPALSKGCAGTIFAFEPNNENYFCARRTIEINDLKNVDLRNCGLGDVSTIKYVKVLENGIALGPRSETCDLAAADSQECEIFRLDDLFPGRRFSIIHLDTEGYEFRILDGARKIIDSCSPLIILEIDDRALKYNEYMQAIGYRPAKQLIYDAKEMVFVNTVYERRA